MHTVEIAHGKRLLRIALLTFVVSAGTLGAYFVIIAGSHATVRSEILTTSRGFGSQQVAYTFNGSSVSWEDLPEQSRFAPPTTTPTSSLSAFEFGIGSTIYTQDFRSNTPDGRWRATTVAPLASPQSEVDSLSIDSPLNNVAFLKSIAVGPVKKIGLQRVGDIATTEYRAMVSLVKLVLRDPQAGQIPPGLIGYLYAIATRLRIEPWQRTPPLVLPVRVWVDTDGRDEQLSAPSVNGVPQHNTVSQTDTLTISDLNVPLRIVAPPARDITIRPNVSPPTASGTVFVREPNGREHAEGGVLVLAFQASGIAWQYIASVGTDGHYSSVDVPAPNTRHTSAVFDTANATDLTCTLVGTVHFTATTTRNVNFVCGKSAVS